MREHMDDQLREALATGRDLYARKDYNRAEAHLSRLAAAEVKYADVYNMLGVIHHDAGRFQLARQSFERALEINPAYTEASLNLAVTCNDMGEYEAAQAVYGRAIQTSTRPGARLDSFVLGKLANLHADIAEVYAAAAAFSEAAAEYRRALVLRPTFLDLRLRLAQVLRDAGQLEDSLREVKTVLAQNPDYLPARTHHAITLFSLGRSDEALTALDQILEDHPEDPRARLYAQMIERHRARHNLQKLDAESATKSQAGEQGT
ncbi:MAG: tetratricopeptide repeat protein [Myxococcota bacterium]